MWARVLKIFRQPCPRPKKVQEISVERGAKLLVCSVPPTGLTLALIEHILLSMLRVEGARVITLDI